MAEGAVAASQERPSDRWDAQRPCRPEPRLHRPLAFSPMPSGITPPNSSTDGYLQRSSPSSQRRLIEWIAQAWTFGPQGRAHTQPTLCQPDTSLRCWSLAARLTAKDGSASAGGHRQRRRLARFEFGDSADFSRATTTWACGSALASAEAGWVTLSWPCRP